MNRMKTLKKILSAFLAFMLIFAQLPSSAFTAYAASGPQDGQVEYSGGTNSASGNYEIEVSKTIKAVNGKENYFDITLTTKTKRHTINLSTDVVIVLDISNTMNSDKNGNSTPVDANKKITQAKAATNSFIQAFATNPNLDIDRRIAVVTFNTNAQVAVPLTEANDQTDFEKNIKGKVDAITAPSSPNDIKFTNIQAGLQLAGNILNTSGARYKYIVLLTDGFPTTYIKSDADSTTEITGYNPIMGGTSEQAYTSYNASKTNQDGYFANTRKEAINYDGTSYSDKAAKKAQATAKSLKDSGINIFSVGVALASQDITKMWELIIDTTGMGANDNYVIGTSDTTYKNWLGNSIAGGPLLGDANTRYSDAYDLKELESDYAAIMQNIERLPEMTLRDFYTLDPMGKEIDFIGFYDKNGKLLGDSLSGQSKENAENTAVYSQKYGSTENPDRIYWDMLKSGFTTDEDGHLIFTLKYRVRLENENASYVWNTSTDTNGKTTLYYAQKYAETGEDVPGSSGNLDYPIPKVEGYCGSLKFRKVDSETKEPIKNITFTLKHNSSDCSVCEGDANIKDMTAITDKNGYAEFTDIPSGHEYTLTETVPEDYTDNHDHTIIVSYGETYVGAKKEENKVSGGFYNDGSEFVIENTKVIPVEIQLQIEKTMDGIAPEDGEFSFRLSGEGIHGDTHTETQKNVLSSGGTSVARFSKMVFNKEGTYEYTIKEVSGNVPTTVYDDSVQNITIVISKTKDGLAFTADVYLNDAAEPVSYVGKKNVVEIFNAGIFENKTRSDAKINIVAKKIMLDGEDKPKSLSGGEFTFRLKDSDGKVIDKKTNDKDGNVTFDQITYSSAGNYTYTVSEVAGNDDGIVYDNSTYTAVVTVSAPEDLTSEDGLKAEVTYSKSGKKADAAVFTNKTRKLPTLTLTGLKTLNGLPAKEGDFSFKLVSVDKDGNEVAGTGQVVKNTKDGLFTFDFEEIIKNLVSENSASPQDKIFHLYKIYEIPAESSTDGETIIYDDTHYELRLASTAEQESEYYTLSAYVTKVTDGEAQSVYHIDRATNIRIGADEDYDITFNNTSTAEIVLSGQKTYTALDGSSIPMTDGMFTFVLHDESGKLIGSAKNTKEGTFSFDKLTFSSSDVGKYAYTISEITEDDADIYYDEAVYTVSFEVKTDKNGHIVITEPEYTVMKNASSHNAEGLVFNNLETNPTHLHITAQKTVNGTTPAVYMQNRFMFSLKAVKTPDGITMKEQAVPEVAGRAVFELMEFNRGMEGEYVFEVRELIPDGATEENGYTYEGITYDTTVHVIEVVVSSEKGDVEKKVTINGEAADSANTQFSVSFDNKYTPLPADVTLSASKTLTGRDMQDSEFTLELLDKNGEVIQTKSIPSSAEGKAAKVNFDKLSFDTTLIGTHNYTIRETRAQIKGITFDTKEYNVAVTIKDSGKGKLTAEISVDGKNIDGNISEAVTFTNRYVPSETSIILKAEKILSGKELHRNDFAFNLYEGTGKKAVLIQTAENGGVRGTERKDVAFERIYYDKEGTYTYTITEVTGTLAGITYDKSVYEAVVTVTDDNIGSLKAEIEYKKSGETVSIPSFTNEYSPAPLTLEVKASKELNGRKLKNGEFGFKLKDEEGNVLETAKNDKDGNVLFSALTFTSEDIGEKTFTVSEVKGNLGGVSYDTAVKTITVEIYDDLSGNILAKISEENVTELNFGTFVNIYTPGKITATITGLKILENKDLTEGDFEFMLLDKQTNEVLQTAQNAADGTFAFEAIEYDSEGLYNYIVIENTQEKMKDVKYDESVYEVAVEVIDDENGELIAAVIASKDNAVTEDIVFTNTFLPDNPETGDNADILLWLMLFATSLMGISSLMILRKRNKTL